MSLFDIRLLRRSVLLSPLVLAGGALFGARRAAAQEKASLLAKAVERVPEAPDDALWQSADLLPVPLAPQAVVKPRVYEAGVKDLTVRALYDAERLALLIEWADGREDGAIAGVADFRDAVAVEFPNDPAAGIPYFAMGEPGKPVTIYQWKADWQFAATSDVTSRRGDMIDDWYPFSGRPAGEIAGLSDYAEERVFLTSQAAGSPLGDVALQARTAVEKLQAEGFGTLTSLAAEAQDGGGRGAYADGRWRVVLTMPIAQAGFAFTPGMTLPMAFAVWDGGKLERGGEKAVSTWYFVSLEKPVGLAPYWGPVVAAGAVLVAQFAALGALRRATGAGAGASDDARS